jgi:6-phosphofructokinase 1
MPQQKALPTPASICDHAAMPKRVGILTGGGDCPGLNAVIRAAVLTLTQRHGYEVLGIEDAHSGLIDLDYRAPNGNVWLGPRDVRGILTKGGTILGTTNKNDPFRFVVKDENGKQHETDVSATVVANAKKLGLEGVITIGGDGSMKIAQKFIDVGLPGIGVPKTIDNDLGCTDQTFGFDTAVQIATDALDRLRDTAASHDRVMLVEVMGRDAGWIALHAGVAGGADAILLPEIPYRLEPIARMLEDKKRSGQTHAVIVVSEGAKPVGGGTSIGEHKLGAMPRLMGAARRVEDDLSRLTSAEIRTTVLGHVQRGGTPTGYDRILATRFGRAAADLAAAGKWGEMVALRGDRIVSLPIEEAIREPKRVRAESQLVQAARALGVVFGDEA